MNNLQKQTIVDELVKLAKKSSQNILSQKSGVSSATISQMINNKWQMISDEMWRKVQTMLRIDSNWKNAKTTNQVLINELLNAVKTKSISVCISHDAGAGKSHTYKKFEREETNVIYIECKNYWGKKSYVKQLLVAAGINAEGTTEEMIEAFIEGVRKLDKPVVIIDQVDKLKDATLDLFMDFYNDLDGHCGFLLSGVPALKKRVLRGVQRDKIGYRELWSRIGRKFIALDPIKRNDVQAICEANGVDDENFIADVYASCEGDLRRVKRSVEQYYLTVKKAA